MLHKVQIFLLNFIVMILCGYGQNIIQIDNGIAGLNETIEIHIRISNNQHFIAFQCDILIPESFSFINNSAQLSGREQDHSLTVFEISDTVLRFICFSAQNNFFSGDTGSVMFFKALSGNITGIFNLKIQNGIIADSMSHNIMDQCIDGTWYIGPVGITETRRFENVIACPNPGRQDQIKIFLEVQNPSGIQIQLYNTDCQLLISENMYLSEDLSILSLHDLINQRSMYPGVYFLNVTTINHSIETKYSQKLILID